MSNPEINIEIKAAVDDAIRGLQNLGGALDSTGTKTDSLATKQKAASGSAKDLIVGLSGVATGAFNLYRGYDDLIDSQVSVDKAMLSAKSTANAAEDAQKRYTDAVLKFGADSPQATASLKDLEIAQERASVAQERATIVQDNLGERYVSFGLSVIPSTITVVAGLSKVINDLGGVTKITEGIQTAYAATVAFLSGGQVLATISTTAHTIATTAWTAISGIATVATTALGVAVNFLSLPIIIVIAAIAGLILVLKYLYDNNETVRNGINGLVDTLRNALGGALTVIGNAWNALTSGIRGAWDTYVAPLVGIIQGFANSISGIFNTLFGWIIGGSSWTDMCKGIGTIWDSVVKPVAGVIQGFADTISGVFNGLKTGLSTIWGGITGIISGAAKTIGDTIGGIISAVGSAWSAITGLGGASPGGGVATSSQTIMTSTGNVGTTEDLSAMGNEPVTTITTTIPTITTPVATPTPTGIYALSTPEARAIGYKGFQEGFEGTISEPTLALIGEAGREEVSIRPTGSPGLPRERTGGGAFLFSPNIYITTGPISGIEDIRQLADVIYEEISKRVRNEMKSNSFYTRGI